ncbi:hypothetical protein KRIGEM_03292 [Komagataeibacter rhaeticus]|nr:hypothetical protein KRIGEM_03292 [Komagataeibacter rhaeticus]
MGQISMKISALPGSVLSENQQVASLIVQFMRSTWPLVLVGAFWHADYGLRSIPSPDAFMAVRQGDLCKLVLGFTVAPISKSRCRLITETRVLCLSDKARQRFTPYWFLIHPVSGLLRRRMLWNIRRIVEQHS